MKNWVKNNRYPLLIALGVMLFEAGVWWLLVTSAGPDRTWIGATVQNSNDQPIYIADIEQIRLGAWGLQNFFAPGPQLPYWHPFYVFVGLLARVTGLSSINGHEVSRLLVAIAAIFLIHTVSRHLFTKERLAAAATALIAFAGGCGWFAFGWWNLIASYASDYIIPDVSGEAYLFSTWLMGAHVALSWALLAYVMWAIWQSISTKAPLKKSMGGWLAVTVLGFIHPYSLLTVAIYLALVTGWRLITSKKIPVSRLWPYVVGALVSTIPHILAQLLNPSRQFLLLQNNLTLKPWHLWFLAALPWLIFILLRWRWKLRLQPQERWLIFWLISAAIAIALPFKWDRKLTEGLGAILIWLSLPAIGFIWTKLGKRQRLATVAFAVFVCLSPLALIRTQIEWAQSAPAPEDELYASRDLMAAWSFIRDSLPTDALVLNEDNQIGSQTPAFTQRHVWYGHNFETPNWNEKRALLASLLTDMPVDQAKELLTREGITVIINLNPAFTARWQLLLDPTRWKVETFGDIRVYHIEP